MQLARITQKEISMRRSTTCSCRLALLAICLLTTHARLVSAQGIIVSAAGPVNRSMGGAATAAPLDALGAIYWNPATIGQLPSDEMAMGLDLLFANHTVASSFGAFSGETHSEAGVFPIPNVGWVHKTSDPYITIGLGVNAVAGFKTNLNADPTNPVLAPAPTGLGRVSSEASFMQLAPVVSLQLTDTLFVGLGPTVTTGQLGVEPFVFDDPNSNGIYASGRATRYHWGAGFQVGAFFKPNECWQYGVSYKSPTWMERFEFYGTDANGALRELSNDIDLPMILSIGTAYSGMERWLVALDVRYIDYANTNGLGDPAEFSGNHLVGLGWSSVLATALGAQYEWNDSISIRAGYTFNQNPISQSESFFNTASPLIYQHMLSTGASVAISDSTACHLAYSYMLENSRSGPIFAPGLGAVPGTNVENSLDSHFLSFGVSLRH
jgi:long-chain fatty acid transport protein